MATSTHRKRSLAFTLVELLVVIGIVALLAAIVLPVFAQAKKRARVTQVVSNVSQIHRAFLLYATDFDDRMAYFPPPNRAPHCRAPDDIWNYVDQRGIPPIQEGLVPYGASLDLWSVDEGAGRKRFEQCGAAITYNFFLPREPLTAYAPECPVFNEAEAFLWNGAMDSQRETSDRYALVTIGGTASFASSETRWSIMDFPECNPRER
ncbi:MAG: type II secretion system GspH family protein [Fimbriimonadaceae bacterium]|nr:type II secretion system GspH family protein [Fimbriimonadaceae bacterium]